VSAAALKPGGWRAYVSFYRRALSSHLAYVSAVWLNLASAAASFGLMLLVWRFVKGGTGGVATPFFAYLALAFALNFTLNFSLERVVGERIREGLIATDLLKPVDMAGLYLAQALSDISFQSVFALASLAAAWPWLGAALLPASAQALAFATVSVFLAVLLQFHIGFLFVQMIFATHSNYGPFSTRMVLHNALSGMIAPLDVFPPALRRVAEALPFHHVIYTPLALWQGRLAGADAWAALRSQVLWLLAMTLLSRWSFDRIRRHLSIQGG
jgi:ABC-2 type transport system permease protein